MKYLTKASSWTPASSKAFPDLSMFAGDFFLPTSLKRRDRLVWARTWNMQFDVLKVLRPSGEKMKILFSQLLCSIFRTCFHNKKIIIIYHCIQVILGNISYIVNDRKQKNWSVSADCIWYSVFWFFLHKKITIGMIEL